MALTDPTARRAAPALPASRAGAGAARRASTRAIQRMAGAAFVIRVAGAAVIYLSQILLARWMGSFEFGTYVYAWTWLLLVGDIIHLGLPLTAQRSIPEYTQRNQLDRLRGFLRASRWLVLRSAPGRCSARSRCTWLGASSTADDRAAPISPASRCRSTRSPTSSTAWRAATTPPPSRCCRSSCFARSS